MRWRASSRRSAPSNEWQAEWKWDGIRSQLIRREGRRIIWSRGDELITERFPELTGQRSWLPDGTVLDGEILPWKDGRSHFRSRSFSAASAERTLGAKILAEVPVVLLAYDLLELGGRGRSRASLCASAARALRAS